MQSRGIDALLENLALRCLGVTEVHHLIQQLINNHKVISYRLFLEFLEVLDENGRQTMQEDDDLCRVGVSPRQRKH